MKSTIQTVLGEIDRNQLGICLTHEHFNAEIERIFYTPPKFETKNEKANVSLETLGWIRQHPYSNRENMTFEGPEVHQGVINEVKKFKEAGGSSIVENTSNGLGRNLKLLKKVAEQTGVNVIAGTGFYVHSSHKEDILKQSEEALATIIRKEITEGCLDDPSIKCGFIGEIGCSWPLTDFERRSLRASAEVESSLGCAVMIHPGRDKSAPEEIIRVYQEAGGRTDRVVMAHLDRTIHADEELLCFAKEAGSFLEFDLFGIETSFYQPNEDVFMPSDGQRIDRIKNLIENGFEDKLLLSQDIHTRHRLSKFGGHGFCHILNSVIPMMSRHGISKEVIHKMINTNPADWLAPQK